jgi:hypothetical protein
MSDWTFDSVPDSNVLKFSEGTQSEMILLIPAENHHEIHIMGKDGEKIAQIGFKDNVLRFEGNIDDSTARLMLLVKRLADQYIAEKLCLKATENS